MLLQFTLPGSMPATEGFSSIQLMEFKMISVLSVARLQQRLVYTLEIYVFLGKGVAIPHLHEEHQHAYLKVRPFNLTLTAPWRSWFFFPTIAPQSLDKGGRSWIHLLTWPLNSSAGNCWEAFEDALEKK